MPDFHVFYYRRRTGEAIAPFAPVPVRTDRIASLAAAVLEQDGDYFGLVDSDDSVLQFIRVCRTEGDERPIRMEGSGLSQRESQVRHITNEEMQDLLRDLPDRLTADVFEGTHFAPSQP